MPRKKEELETIGPQPGKQEAFLSCGLDIAIYGGSAGAGKSMSLLLIPLYYRNVSGFTAIIFRRTFAEITTPQGLWDKAQELYSKLGAKCRSKPEYTAVWPSGAKVVFRHLEYESDVYAHQGGEYCFIGFDEVTLFTELQFTYLLSRNRSTCGVKPFVRATCNPDSDSWVKTWISWWLDQDTGFPIEGRSGVAKYFTRDDSGGLRWVDKGWRHPEHPDIGPKSITFIPAKMEDNPILMKLNPEYRAWLLSLSKVDRDRLLFGNWKSKAEDGMFKPEWIEKHDTLPVPTTRRLRIWDRANTEKDEKNKNPDFTAGVLGYMSGDILCIEDLRHFRASPAQNEEKILETARHDGRDTEILIEQEPASSGKDVMFHYKERVLKDFVVRAFRPSGDRTALAKPLSARAEQRKVWIKTAPWNRAFEDEVGSFPPKSGAGHDDIVCATAQLLIELLQDSRVISGYGSKNLMGDKEIVPQEGLDYAVFYQEKDLRLYICFMRWDYQNKKLYVYDEMVLQSFTVQQLKAIIAEKCKTTPILHGNDFMFKDGDSLARLLGREQISMTESPRFNDEGSVSVVSQMFKTRDISVHVRCVETDRQLRSWMIENGKPQTERIGCAKALCMVVSDLRDKRKIEPVAPPKPYSREKAAMSQPPTNPNIPISTTTIPTGGYGHRLKHWMA